MLLLTVCAFFPFLLSLNRLHVTGTKFYPDYCSSQLEPWILVLALNLPLKYLKFSLSKTAVFSLKVEQRLRLLSGLTSPLCSKYADEMATSVD